MPGSKKDGESSHGFHGLMDSLKDKLSDTKLHDAKISLIHKKSVPPPTKTFRADAGHLGIKLANWATW